MHPYPSRFRSPMRALTLAALLSTTMINAAHAVPSQEEMWRIIQEQQQEIKALKTRLEKAENKAGKAERKATQAEQKVVQAEKKVAAASEQVEKAVAKGGMSSAPGWWQRTHLGGYGEMHYNGLKNGDDQIDFHRYILYVGHDFTDDLRFYSELELEHSISGEGKTGEIELEQAYIEKDFSKNHRGRAGLFLIPVGILNETHEPTTFYGVERNPVENNIIPTTWWEGGVGFSGLLTDEFSYDFAAHSGLSTPTTGASAFKIRNGRQKVGNAEADAGAVTGAITWTGVPGIELGVSTQYQQDLTQGDFSERVPATLVETHADIRRGPWGLRALFARWDVGGNAAAALGRDIQQGWYVEPSYRFTTSIGDVGFFGRYNRWNNEAGLSTVDDTQQYDAGVNFWPHPDVVLKADMAFVNYPKGSTTADDAILNLGVGFRF